MSAVQFLFTEVKMATSKKADRLTNLPEEIRLHILSFLDTRSVVRTSTLSKQWKTLWTYVPNLDFRHEDDRFEEFVLEVLSRRNPNACVGKLQLRTNKERDNNLALKVIDYALSHSVNTLQLSYCKFPPSFCFRPTVATLHLELCQFEMCDDAFVSCPNLKDLRLLQCCFGDCKVLKISGTQLVNLTIDSLGTHHHTNVYASFKVEISAPKLRTLSHRDSADLDFSSINLPSLEHAEIRVFMPSRIRLTAIEADKKMAYINLFKFFRSLHHVQSLTLYSCTCEALATIPGILESQHPPFTRLKTLELKGDFSDETVPERLERYFVEGHPSVETTVVKTLRY